MKLIKSHTIRSYLTKVAVIVGLAAAFAMIITGTAIDANATASCAATMLKVGSRGDCVADLQNRLNSAGSSVGRADSQFGPKTRDGVKDYQRKNGLKDDGIAGTKTWGSLINGGVATPAGSSVPLAPSGQGFDSKSRGQASDLQNRLATAGFPVGRAGADGVIGGDTKMAVKAFQQHYGIPATGAVDGRTWQTLLANPSAPASRLGHLNAIKSRGGVNIVADKSDRTAYVFRDGRLLRAITVRFGGEGVQSGVPYSKSTPSGVFWVQAKKVDGRSLLYNADMPYFTVFNGDIGFHQSANFANNGYGLNGTSGSHGCVNIGNANDAKFIYDSATPGHTRVAVQG